MAGRRGKGTGQGLVIGLGLGALLCLSGAEWGLLPTDGLPGDLVARHAARGLAFLKWDGNNHLEGTRDQKHEAKGRVGAGTPEGPGTMSAIALTEDTPSEGPPLSSSGPGSDPRFFMRLDAFRFPSEDDLLASVGTVRGTAYDRSYGVLREALVGSGGSRERLRRRCAAGLDADEKSGRLEQAPSIANLECYLFRWERLARNLQRDAKMREREDEERFETPAAEVVSPSMRGVPRRVRSQDDWNRLVGLNYRAAVAHFRPSGQREALRIARFALFDPNPCATTGARSGLLRAMEDFLPDPEVFETMAALYVHQKTCLRPGDEAFEEIHFRLGLLFLERGRLEDAGTSFSFALEDAEGRDAYRVLFWRGLLEAFRSTPGQGDWMQSSEEALPGVGTQRHKPMNVYWKRLIATYPLSFHALVADSITGYTLHRKILDQPMPWVGVFQGANWDAQNAGAFLYALFIARNDHRVMKVFAQSVIKNLEPANFEQGLFFGLAQREAGFTRGAIKAMFTAASRYGNGRFNLAVLDLLYPRLYVETLEKHGSDVDLAVALSLMRQESSFNPHAVSAARAKGLMQVLPGTARLIMKKRQINLFDPVQNIQAGTRYLQHLLKRYDQNYVETIASYNAGPGKVARWKERYITGDALLFADLIPYRETRNYVTGLLRNIHWYRVLLNGDKHEELISSTDTATWTARSLVPDPAQWGIESLAQPVNLVFEPVPDFRRQR